MDQASLEWVHACLLITSAAACRLRDRGERHAESSAAGLESTSLPARGDVLRSLEVVKSLWWVCMRGHGDLSMSWNRAKILCDTGGIES